MQNRYAGDIGDYAKLALLRALMGKNHKLGVAWYLFPDELHNNDGRHTAYLDHPGIWRHLDPDLFDHMKQTVRKSRSLAQLEFALPSSTRFARETIAHQRCSSRSAWFSRVQQELMNCEIVFADPDNGLVDDSAKRRRQPNFGKQMPLSEARTLAGGRPCVIYHHNSRFKGGHDLEVEYWLAQLGSDAFAIRATAYSCRTFFVLNPDRDIMKRAEQFCSRWVDHKVRLHERRF